MTKTKQPARNDHLDLTVLAEDIRIAVGRLHRAIRYNDTDALSPTLGATLATVERHGSISLGDLAAHERMAKPTITDIVEKLERQKLIEKRQDNNDRRISRVQITKSGRQFLTQSRARRTAWLAQQLEELSDADISRLIKTTELLEKLARFEPESKEGN